MKRPRRLSRVNQMDWVKAAVYEGVDESVGGLVGEFRKIECS